MLTTGPITSRVNQFFERKSIQRTFNYVVYFDASNVNGNSMENLYNLKSYHAISIEVPDYSFNKVETYAGPFVRTTPVLNHNGFEFTIKFEEDNFGNIKNLIQKLVRLNIDEDGYHRTTKIENLEVAVYTQDGGDRTKNGYGYRISFKDCYFLKASPASYSYSDNGKIEYDITFNCDHYTTTQNVYGSDA